MHSSSTGDVWDPCGPRVVRPDVQSTTGGWVLVQRGCGTADRMLAGPFPSENQAWNELFRLRPGVRPQGLHHDCRP